MFAYPVVTTNNKLDEWIDDVSRLIGDLDVFNDNSPTPN